MHQVYFLRLFKILTGLTALLLATSVAADVYDPETFELKTTSWREDWLYPLRVKSAPSVVEPAPRPYHVRFGYETRSFDFDISPEDSDDRLEFKPNNGRYITLTLTHADKGSVSIGHSIGHNEDPALYGKSDYTDIRLEFPSKNWYTAFHYSQYRGFYLENSQLVNPNQQPYDPKYQLPNMESRSMGAKITFVAAPHRFSLPALINQTERQVARGGSALVGLGLRHDKIRNDGPFIPQQAVNMQNLDKKARGIDSTSIVPTIGYGYQYNFTSDWFISGSIMIGWGFSQLRALQMDGEDKTTKVVQQSQMDIVIGYNGKENYFGFRANADAVNISKNETNYSNSVMQSSAYYGFRW